MNENRRQILELLAAGKITADEAERLLVALDLNPTRISLWLRQFVESSSPAVTDVCPL
jgi:DNA-binding transcriptional ArsR family regulator